MYERFAFARKRKALWRRLAGHGRALAAADLIGALGLDGICAATGTAEFLAFVTQVLIPVLARDKPDAVVVMDNLAAHKAAGVRKALEAAGIAYRYLPA